MSKYSFYYDESAHSRVINSKTINADGFFDTFVTLIVGWDTENESELFRKYECFEKKYGYRKTKGEIKSQTIRPAQVENGFASLNEENARLLNDFLSTLDEKVRVYYSTFSKVEFLVLQVFRNYNNKPGLDMDAFKYTITKALVTYKPQKVLEALYGDPDSLVPELIAFFREIIEVDKLNTDLKRDEIKAYKQAIFLLRDVEQTISLKWDYHMPFMGFHKYLDESGINDYCLTVDQEGREKNTLRAAIESGLTNVREGDSKECVGIRVADMIAGIIAKLMRALSIALRPNSIGTPEKTILKSEWFKLNETQLKVYKQLYRLLVQQDNKWYKAYAGIYSDDLVTLIALLEYLNQFDTIESITNDLEIQGENFNGFACSMLANRFDRMHDKIPFEPISCKDTHDEYFTNSKGAKVYYDIQKQPDLYLVDGTTEYEVLSVGFGKQMIPLITIKQNGIIMCYKLPIELADWVSGLLYCSKMGLSILPSKVSFTKRDGRYYADLL